MTLFQKYGGVPTVTSIIKLFYSEVLKDPDVAKYFAKTHFQTLIDHQVRFVSFLLGKADKSYTPAYIFNAHSGRYITDSAYTDVINIFRNVLTFHHWEQRDVETVIAILETFRSTIVGFPSSVRRG